MSGITPIGSSLSTSSSGTSGSSAAASSTSTSLLSSVGKSLLTTGQAPNVTPAATTNSQTITKYQSEYLTLQQQDTAELLYASFLSPTAGLSNADEVLGQAAQLLGTPGSLASSQSTASTSSTGSTSSSASSTTSGSSSSASSGSASTTTSTSSDPLSSIPSVASILAASDAEAQQTLTAYANAPADSSIIDYQA